MFAKVMGINVDNEAMLPSSTSTSVRWYSGLLNQKWLDGTPTNKVLITSNTQTANAVFAWGGDLNWSHSTDPAVVASNISANTNVTNSVKSGLMMMNIKTAEASVGTLVGAYQVAENPKATYTYVGTSQEGTNKDFNILSYTTNRNQNLLEKLRLGSYASYRMFFNPLTFEFTDPEKGAFKMQDYVSKSKNLGQDLKLPKVSSESNLSLGDLPSRFITQILDLGTLEKEVSTDQNSDPFKYQSQALMRYNVLFTQVIEMTIPSNTNLRAGDIIECQFPKISQGKKSEYDDDQSGLYMIKELWKLCKRISQALTTLNACSDFP